MQSRGVLRQFGAESEKESASPAGLKVVLVLVAGRFIGGPGSGW